MLGGSNTKKWGDQQKEKLFIYKSIDASISFKEEHHSLSKLHIPLGRGRGGEGGIGRNSSVAKHSGECLKQILIHNFQHLIRGIYENRGVYFFLQRLNQYIIAFASAKIPEREGSISPYSFFGQLPISHKF